MHPESAGDVDEVHRRRVPVAALDHAYVVGMGLGGFGQVLLSHLPILPQLAKRRLNGGKKALFILAAGCGGTLVLLLATCGISVAVGMFQAMLPPQIEITYRGRTSGLDQLAASYGVPQGPANTAKNTSRKP